MLGCNAVPFGKAFMPRTPQHTNTMPSFAQLLSQRRKQRGISQDDLAEMSGVDQGLISKYERAILHPPDGERVKALFLHLAPEGADEGFARSIINEGLIAAGFAPLETPETDEHEAIDFLRGQSNPNKDRALKVMRAMFAEDDNEDNAGNIGKRAE